MLRGHSVSVHANCPGSVMTMCDFCVNVAVAWQHLVVASWEGSWGLMVAACFCTGSSTGTPLAFKRSP